MIYKIKIKDKGTGEIDYVIMGDSYKEFECEGCGKKFECNQVVTIDYRTKRDCSLNGEECEAGDYHCKKCDSYDVNVTLRLKQDAISEVKE